MSFSEDSFITFDHGHLYSPGRLLVLNPHTPPDPYGTSDYPDPPNLKPADMGPTGKEKGFSRTRLVFDDRNQPLNLDTSKQDEKDRLMHLEVVQLLVGNSSVGYRPGSQKLLCKVVKRPLIVPDIKVQELPRENDLVFVKVYDPLFYSRTPDPLDAPFKATTRADMDLSDEVGAYSSLYKKGLTGYPKIAPQYHGCWTAKVGSLHPVFQGLSRHVGVLLTEYIDGVILRRCFSYGHAPTEALPLYYTSPSPATLQVDEETRLGTMAQLLEGFVEQEYAGITHCNVHPDKIILSLRNGPVHLEKPRLCLVGYRTAVVDDLMRDPQDPYEHFPTMPHPILRFGIERLDPFLGWIPPEWKTKAAESAPLHCWILETFGDFNSNKYTTFRPLTSPEISLLTEASSQDLDDSASENFDHAADWERYMAAVKVEEAERAAEKELPFRGGFITADTKIDDMPTALPKAFFIPLNSLPPLNEDIVIAAMLEEDRIRPRGPLIIDIKDSDRQDFWDVMQGRVPFPSSDDRLIELFNRFASGTDDLEKLKVASRDMLHILWILRKFPHLHHSPGETIIRGPGLVPAELPREFDTSLDRLPPLDENLHTAAGSEFDRIRPYGPIHIEITDSDNQDFWDVIHGQVALPTSEARLIKLFNRFASVADDPETPWQLKHEMKTILWVLRKFPYLNPSPGETIIRGPGESTSAGEPFSSSGVHDSPQESHGTRSEEPTIISSSGFDEDDSMFSENEPRVRIEAKPGGEPTFSHRSRRPGSEAASESDEGRRDRLAKGESRSEDSQSTRSRLSSMSISSYGKSRPVSPVPHVGVVAGGHQSEVSRPGSAEGQGNLAVTSRGIRSELPGSSRPRSQVANLRFAIPEVPGDLGRGSTIVPSGDTGTVSADPGERVLHSGSRSRSSSSLRSLGEENLPEVMSQLAIGTSRPQAPSHVGSSTGSVFARPRAQSGDGGMDRLTEGLSLASIQEEQPAEADPTVQGPEQRPEPEPKSKSESEPEPEPKSRPEPKPEPKSERRIPGYLHSTLTSRRHSVTHRAEETPSARGTPSTAPAGSVRRSGSTRTRPPPLDLPAAGESAPGPKSPKKAGTLETPGAASKSPTKIAASGTPAAAPKSPKKAATPGTFGTAPRSPVKPSTPATARRTPAPRSPVKPSTPVTARRTPAVGSPATSTAARTAAGSETPTPSTASARVSTSTAPTKAPASTVRARSEEASTLPTEASAPASERRAAKPRSPTKPTAARTRGRATKPETPTPSAASARPSTSMGSGVSSAARSIFFSPGGSRRVRGREEPVQEHAGGAPTEPWLAAFGDYVRDSVTPSPTPGLSGRLSDLPILAEAPLPEQPVVSSRARGPGSPEVPQAPETPTRPARRSVQMSTTSAATGDEELKDDQRKS
ncbi:hypothetical protein CTRI78_v003572 [Colletotrichum trifolii]|uniref:Uncharacterized protein n=1 Tax=Colletotrichum trifolii TaxID=5466 RepID=A0A4R8RJ80_COLTR|nr:hypothetical protein CTRI78_v003572 [Colletotrichum trifolii]